MPLWGTILTVCFSGIIALMSTINFFRMATKEQIDRIERRLENLEQRLDRHLEGHS